MKKLFFLLTLTLPLIGFAQDRMTLSLEQALEQALKTNQDLLNAQLDVDYSNTQVKEILASGLPQVNGNVNFTHSLKIQTSVFPDFISPTVYQVLFAEGLVDPKDISVANFPAQFGVPYSMQATVGVNQLIFDGTFFLGVKAASEFVNINKLIASKSEVDIKEGVTKAYYLALISEQNLNQLNKSLANLNKMKAETKAMYDAGFVEKLDHDRLVLSVANLEISINNLKKQADLAKMLLLNSMGLPPSQEVNLTTPLPEFNADNFSMNYGMDGSGDSRIEIKLLEQQQSLNHLNLKRYKSGYVPNLYLNGNFGYNTFAMKGDFGNLGNTWYPIASYGLNLNVPIFDGLYKKAKTDQVKIDILKTKNSLDQLHNGIALEVKQSQIAYTNAYSNMELQKKSADLALEIYNTTAIKFKEGVGSSFELVQAESDLTTANTNYLNALYELSVAKINLDKALGNI